MSDSSLEHNRDIGSDPKADRVRRDIAAEQIRCYFCNKMFFPGRLGQGTHIEPKCPRCKRINTITIL